MATTRIISFFDPQTHSPYSARSPSTTLPDILSWSDSKLERQHDFIQWLFPVPEASAYSYEAPVLTRGVVESFREREELRTELRRAWVRMMRSVLSRVGGEVVDQLLPSKSHM
jgi:hypothetical protein